ncbi:MAG TPA: lamin tail domain-containing protein, partial [Vicinamibacteria bacterium]|nr:lamin tail domain-containing protein [Vicinamibacteria bacterium]
MSLPAARGSRRVVLPLAAVAAVALQIPLPAARAVSPNVVISQVYGGGGNSGATYRNDFIELFNRGGSPASLAGWSVQYASATGTGSFGSNTGQITELPAVTLAPGQYLLVQEAQGTGGTTGLPAPDVVDTTPINMSGTGGKVALVSTASPLGCNGGSTPCPPAALALIVDLVGWDGANFYEGSPAPATTNTTAALRAGGGCVDTDSNASD